MGYLRYDDAKEDAHYQALVAIAVTRLQQTGAFQQDDVVEEAGLKVLADALRWPYIVKMIEEEADVSLIPMAAAFFRRKTKQEMIDFPERFIAGIGHAKKAVGYCIATQNNGLFTIYRLDNKRKRVTGAVNAVNRDYAAAKKLGLPVSGEPYKIPVQQEVPAPQLAGPSGKKIA